MGSSSSSSNSSSLKSISKASRSVSCGKIVPTYAQLKTQFTSKLQASKKITFMAMYKSPLNDNPSLPEHHQVIIQLDKLVWIKISWCIEGLDVDAKLTKEQLTNKPGNEQFMSSNFQHDSSRLKEFIIKNQNKIYDLLNWNCRHYAIQLWKQFNIDPRGASLEISKDGIKLVPGNSPQTWYGMPA